MALGLHVRCGIEDVLWKQDRSGKATTVEQIKQLVRIAGEFGRPIATPEQAREITRIGVFYDTADETLAANGFSPNRNGGDQGFLRKPAQKTSAASHPSKHDKGNEALAAEATP
jgi:hypothetical protein